MNYKKIYDQLVEKCRVRGLDKSALEGYYEKHHIVPRCMGGSDDNENLVLLTGREHFVAHMLLWKAYKDHQGLFYSVFMMSKKSKVTSRLYEILSEAQASKLAEFNKDRTGFNSPVFKDLTGQIRGKLTVISFEGWIIKADGNRVSSWYCQCSCGNTSVLSASHLTKNSGTRSCGCDRLMKMKASTGDKNPFFGKTHTEDTKKIMSEKKLGRGEWNKGLVRSDENKLKISITLKSRNQRPWESPMVYTRPDNLLKWALADYYYELYLTNTSLTSAKFTTLYNRTHNDTLPAIAFKAMHSEFVRGWNPSQDSEWLSFKEEYERT